MDINLNVTVKLEPELKEAMMAILSKLAQTTSVKPVEAAEPIVTKEPENNATEEEKPDVAQNNAPETTVTQTALTAQDIRAAMKKAKNAGKLAEAKDVLKQVGGVDMVADLPEAKFDAVMKALGNL